MFNAQLLQTRRFTSTQGPVMNKLETACIETTQNLCDSPRHQALDDCIALRHVMSFAAARLGVRLSDLHRRFAVSLNEPDSCVQIHVLLDI